MTAHMNAQSRTRQCMNDTREDRGMDSRGHGPVRQRARMLSQE